METCTDPHNMHRCTDPHNMYRRTDPHNMYRCIPNVRMYARCTHHMVLGLVFRGKRHCANGGTVTEWDEVHNVSI